MSQKIIKLSFEPENEFLLISLATSLSDYNLCWAINKQLGISLTREDDFMTHSRDDVSPAGFSLYKYTDDELIREFSLISNKSENGYLTKGFNKIDFFMKVSGELSDSEIDEYTIALKNIRGMILVSRLSEAIIPQNQWKNLSSVFASM